MKFFLKAPHCIKTCARPRSLAHTGREHSSLQAPHWPEAQSRGTGFTLLPFTLGNPGDGSSGAHASEGERGRGRYLHSLSFSTREVGGAMAAPPIPAKTQMPPIKGMFQIPDSLGLC